MKTIKTIALLALVSIALLGCKKDGSGLRGDAPLYINGKNALKTSDKPVGTLKEIETMSCNGWHDTGVPDERKDTVNCRIIFFSDFVVGEDGSLTKEFITRRDYVFMARFFSTRDTVAYIPNSTMIAAEAAITAAHARGDYAECYRLFEEAFVFIPITGAEWRALQAQGLN